MAGNNSSVNRLAGTASFTVGGVTYLLSGELSYIVSTVERESLVGMDSVHGYKEMPHVGQIKGTLRDNSSIKVADFNAMTSVNITLQLANGKTIVGSNMWCTGVQEAKATDGTFEVSFEGNSVTEN